MIDLGAATFLDSSGLSVTVAARQLGGASCGWLASVDNNEPIAKTRDTAGINTLIDVFAAQRAAIDHRPV